MNFSTPEFEKEHVSIYESLGGYRAFIGDYSQDFDTEVEADRFLIEELLKEGLKKDKQTESLLGKTDGPISVLDIQAAVYRYFYQKNHQVNAANIYYHKRWESDFLSMSKAGYLHEVEIKLTKSDYKADFKKKRKTYGGKEGKSKHAQIESGALVSYFWFAMPEGLVELEEVPEYAGVIYVRKSKGLLTLHPARPAPKLNKNPIGAEGIRRILQKTTWKFWDMHLKSAPDLISITNRGFK